MVLRSNPLSSAHKYVNDFNALPPFGLFNISSHLIYSSTEYHKQGLAVYKACNDYRLFEEGYIESLLTKPLSSVGVHLFVGKVRSSMKTSDNNGKASYDIWYTLEAKGASRGSVLKAKCTCKGGKDGGCKHISAAMYFLDDLLNECCTNSITSGPYQWVKRPIASSKPCEIKKLIIGKLNSPLKRHMKAKVLCQKKRTLRKRTKATKKKPTTPTRRKKKRKDHIFCESIDVNFRNEDQRRYPSPEPFASSFQKSKKTLVRHLQYSIFCRIHSCQKKIFTNAMMQFSSRKNVVAILENEVQEICTLDEICHIDAITVKQW